MTETLTISALERLTGVTRTTIHYYIRRGLLPQAAKTAASRSLYSGDHVRILRRIEELKRDGLSLTEIKKELRPAVDSANENSTHLAGRERERIHQRIVQVAAEHFVSYGYEGTHVSTIIEKAGITPHVFYSHFTGKSQLLAECFSAFVDSNMALLAPQLASTDDVGQRLLYKVIGNLRSRAMGVDVMTLIRSGEIQRDADFRGPIEDAWGKVLGHIMADLADMRPSDAPPSPVPDELIAYALVGAFDNTYVRSTWDDTYTPADVLRAHLWLYMAVHAALSGAVDVDSLIERYEESIQEIAESAPAVPLLGSSLGAPPPDENGGEDALDRS